MIQEGLLAGLLLLGGLVIFFAALGLLRMPDVILRMHAATKAGTLGVGLIAFALALHLGSEADSGKAVAKTLAVVLLLLFTAPIGAHLIGRASLAAGVELWGIKRSTRLDASAQRGNDTDE